MASPCVQASPLNKPSNQAIVPMCAVPELMPTLPLTKLRFLGGKLGQVQALASSRVQPRTLSQCCAQELADAGYTTCGSLQAASLEELWCAPWPVTHSCAFLLTRGRAVQLMGTRRARGARACAPAGCSLLICAVHTQAVQCVQGG